jgi:hypothetical protein
LHYAVNAWFDKIKFNFIYLKQLRFREPNLKPKQCSAPFLQDQ